MTATFHPAHPTVGDRITVDFPRSVVLDRSPAYEIVLQHGSRAVVRTFEPKPFALSGTTDGVRFRNLVVPVRSVLAAGDAMQPAPLKPPQRLPMPRAPFVAIGVAALVAAAAWAGLLALHRRRAASRARRAGHSSGGALPGGRGVFDGEAAGAAMGLSRRSHPDLPRRARIRGRPHELQLLASLGGHELIAEILRRGDLEKFSPWGAPPGDFSALAQRALTIPDEFEPAPVAEEAA